jgi:hypothetical protein
MLKKAENRLLTRAAQKYDRLFAATYRAATVRERAPNRIIQQPAMLTWAFLITPLMCLPALADAQREQQLEERVRLLEQRLAALEQRLGPVAPASPLPAVDAQPQKSSANDGADFTLPGGVNAGVYFDGNYTWNTSRPYNRINLLRAYDVLHNNFNINQTGVVIERQANPAEGRRFGIRLDLMYGQATETVQGGTQNELRPQVYRPVFQAYGTYVVPLGSGLSVDFGKFAGSLGYEGNYTKDQFNYSRAYFFNFLPFYHMGFRSNYAFNDRVSVTYWLVNGTQQTEDFNGFKSNAILLNVKPSSAVSWNINYYIGRESRQYVAIYNPGLPTLPTQPGLPVEALRPAPDGRFHVIDSYASWKATEKLTLVGEADYVVNRTESSAPPLRVAGGAAYAAYRFNPAWMLAARFEYLSDRHGLFSGISQALKENTVTLTYEPRSGFQLRGEWRRDYSNQRFFIARDPDRLSSHQNTAALGLLWWFGSKTGSW